MIKALLSMSCLLPAPTPHNQNPKFTTTPAVSMQHMPGLLWPQEVCSQSNRQLSAPCLVLNTTPHTALGPPSQWRVLGYMWDRNHTQAVQHEAVFVRGEGQIT